MKLTQEKIEEIRKRAEAATESQWFVMHNTDIMIEEPAGSGDTHSVAYSKTSNDAEFIANARQDIPALLAHISSLEQLVSDFEIRSDNDDRIKAKRLDRIVDLEIAIQDALSIAEMQKENFAMEPWASLEEALRDDEE